MMRTLPKNLLLKLFPFFRFSTPPRADRILAPGSVGSARRRFGATFDAQTLFKSYLYLHDSRKTTYSMLCIFKLSDRYL